jgi:hypothetical protein
MTNTTTTRIPTRGLGADAARIQAMAQDLQDRYDGGDADLRAQMEDLADLPMADWLALGDKPSRGLVMQVISAEMAQALHAIHTDFHGTAAIGERIVFILAMGELLPKL